MGTVLIAFLIPKSLFLTYTIDLSYLYASTALRLLHIPCSVSFLRWTVSVTQMIPSASLIEYAIFAASTHLVKFRPHEGPEDYWLEALIISIFPLITFFSTLFYTDVPGLWAVLCCYVAAMNRKHAWAMVVSLSSLVGPRLMKRAHTDLVPPTCSGRPHFLALPTD